MYDGEEVSLIPTNCLMMRNLSEDCTSDTILSFIGSLFNCAIKSIRFSNSPDDTPRRSCFVELHTISEATTLLNLMATTDHSWLSSSSSSLVINYCRRRSSHSQPIASTSNAASAALAAAQWTNRSETIEPVVASVTVNGITYQKFPTPDPTQFQLEPTSGFLYDHVTRLYFDPKSKYYYNSITQQYLYWSHEHETYLPVEQSKSSQTVSEVQQNLVTSESSTEPISKTFKSVQKEKIKTNTNVDVDPIPWIQKPSSSRSTEVSQSNKLERHSSGEKSSNESSPEPEEHPKEILTREEEKLLDFDKLLCLLCKRQLASKEQLTKHRQVSGLHKSNLEVLAQSVLTKPQLMLLNAKQPVLEYIDRAKERRKKWGDTEIPLPNPEKEKYLKQSVVEQQSLPIPQQPAPRIDSSNKGNRMLKAMGWKEGQGLGKKSTGRTDIIEVEARNEAAGLGMKSGPSRSIAGESYKDAVKRTMAQRFKELSQNK
jgi:RNA-binding protein 5/10